jgi:hypothetical protein
MAQPQNLLPLFDAAAAPPPLVIPPLPPGVAEAFGVVEAAVQFGDAYGVDLAMGQLWHAINHHNNAAVAAAAAAAAAVVAEDALDYDLSTVPVDIDEYYEMNEVFADDLPGSLVNAVQQARPALDLVRAREDVPNRLKNRFYYAVKRIFLLFLGNAVNLNGWRNTYEAEMGEVLPHLPAALIDDLVAPLDAFLETFQPAVDEMLGLRQADGTFAGFPDLHNDLYLYVRRMLRIPDPPPELEDFEDWPVQEEVVAEPENAPQENPPQENEPQENEQEQWMVPPPPPGHPQLLPNGGGLLEEEDNDLLLLLPPAENNPNEEEPP